VTRGRLPQRAGSLGLNGGGATATVPPKQNSKTKLTWFSRLLRYWTRPGNEVGLFYNAPQPTWERSPRI